MSRCDLHIPQCKPGSAYHERTIFLTSGHFIHGAFPAVCDCTLNAESGSRMHMQVVQYIASNLMIWSGRAWFVAALRIIVNACSARILSA
jgi:hypothetical protein